jgi:hypothetical protein
VQQTQLPLLHVVDHVVQSYIRHSVDVERIAWQALRKVGASRCFVYAVEANRRSSLDEDVCIEVGARLRETVEELGIGRLASLYRSSEGTVELITGFEWVQHQIKSGFSSR